MATRGRAIVTDLQFWKSSANWTTNRERLERCNCEFIEDVNIFNVAKGKASSVDFQRIGLVVVGGFAPHYRVGAAAQALSHQIPHASLMFLYASRDEPPNYQDNDKVHIQAWTADAKHGYVVLAGGEGQGGRSRCYSSESIACRSSASDPALVKLSIFTDRPSSVTYVGTKISPSMYVEHFLASNKDVLFCAEGDASLSSSCLTPSVTCYVPESTCRMETQRYHRDYGLIESYGWLLDQCSRSEQVHDPALIAYELQNIQIKHGKTLLTLQLERIADIWAESWPTVNAPSGTPTATNIVDEVPDKEPLTKAPRV